jgi:hypothetical protein
VGLAATASTPGLLTAAAGLSHPPTAAARGHAMLAPLLLSPSRPPFSITPNPIPKVRAIIRWASSLGFRKSVGVSRPSSFRQQG